MYYKIINQESEVYKKLRSMREIELQYEEDNKKAINEKVGLYWETYLGHPGQQNFGRTTEYEGFKFTEPEKVDLKIWKLHPEHEGVYIPNNRSKIGRELSEFLRNGLKRHYFDIVYDNLNIEHPYRKFTFPYVEICGDVVILYLDNKSIPEDENIIEITSKEFNEIYKQSKAKS